MSGLSLGTLLSGTEPKPGWDSKETKPEGNRNGERERETLLGPPEEMAIISWAYLPGQGNRVGEVQGKDKRRVSFMPNRLCLQSDRGKEEYRKCPERTLVRIRYHPPSQIRMQSFLSNGYQRLRAIEISDPQSRKQPRIWRNIIQRTQASRLRCRTDYYKIFWFAQQKMLTSCSAATSGFRNGSWVRQPADAGSALCSWDGARAVLTGTIEWGVLSHTARLSQQGWGGWRRADV